MPAVRLFIGNLPYNATEDDIRSHFATVGLPTQIVRPLDRETGRARGFAFVEYGERAMAEEAVKRFDGQLFMGRPLAVSEARARDDRSPMPPRPGGFSGPPRPGGFSGPPRPGGFSPGGAGGGYAPRPGGFRPQPGDPPLTEAAIAARATSDLRHPRKARRDRSLGLPRRNAAPRGRFRPSSRVGSTVSTTKRWPPALTTTCQTS